MSIIAYEVKTILVFFSEKINFESTAWSNTKFWSKLGKGLSVLHFLSGISMKRRSKTGIYFFFFFLFIYVYFLGTMEWSVIPDDIIMQVLIMILIFPF